MQASQEPKYAVNFKGKVVNRRDGKAIPDNEPIMIFRAKDKHAAAAIEHYLTLCSEPAHATAVAKRLADFKSFAMQFPEQMHEPDTEQAP